MQQAKRILLIGLGRWGANHFRVLQSMPIDLFVADADPARLNSSGVLQSHRTEDAGSLFQIVGKDLSAVCDYNVAQYKIKTFENHHVAEAGEIKAKEGAMHQLEFPPEEPLRAELARFWMRLKPGVCRWWTALMEWKRFEWSKPLLNRRARESGSTWAID
jgi:hypothetical protein